jgi:hypothetical protein
MPDNDNPWENAVDNPSWSQANFSMDQKEDVEESAERNPGQDDLAGENYPLVLLIRGTSSMSSVGFAILVYGIVLHKERKESKALIGTLLVLGTSSNAPSIVGYVFHLQGHLPAGGGARQCIFVVGDELCIVHRQHDQS